MTKEQKTPFQEAGYTPEDEFRVTLADWGDVFNVGDRVYLNFDDGSDILLFINVKTSDTSWWPLKDVEKIEKEFKMGDVVRILPLNDTEHSFYTQGDVGVVQEVDSRFGSCIVNFNGYGNTAVVGEGLWSVHLSSLTLVSEDDARWRRGLDGLIGEYERVPENVLDKARADYQESIVKQANLDVGESFRESLPNSNTLIKDCIDRGVFSKPTGNLPASYGKLRCEDHPLYPIYMRAIEQAMYGKGERHGGASIPFLEQPWNHYAKLHGRGFLTGQAAKKLEEAASTREGDAFTNEVLGSIVFVGMSILHEETNKELNND